MRTTSFIKVILPFFTLLLISCESDPIEPLNQPTVNETTLDNLTYTSIDIQGSITPNGIFINSRGICWDTNPNPSIINNKSSETDNLFTSSISNLIANTTYYYKTYATSSLGTIYGEEMNFNTLSLNNTNWNLDTVYPPSGSIPNGLTIYSRVNFYDDGSTKFDELDLPGQSPGVFITIGSWSLDGNDFTYIWEGNDINNSTYVYIGTISGMEMSGTYTHSSEPSGTWSAIFQ
ncbi:MAG: hypothetical protein COA67_09885 [Lutibacter sp.]|nr:MAG: hypothetical protein COA67_09885 [Lutibacter sp.]